MSLADPRTRDDTTDLEALKAQVAEQAVEIRALQLLIAALLHHAGRTSPPILRALRRGLEVGVPPDRDPGHARFADAVLDRARGQLDAGLASSEGDAADHKATHFAKDLLGL